jgi:hypothetical protein
LEFLGTAVRVLLAIYGKMSPIANCAKKCNGKIFVEVKKILGEAIVFSS